MLRRVKCTLNSLRCNWRWVAGCTCGPGGWMLCPRIRPRPPPAARAARARSHRVRPRVLPSMSVRVRSTVFPPAMVFPRFQLDHVSRAGIESSSSSSAALVFSCKRNLILNGRRKTARQVDKCNSAPYFTAEPHVKTMTSRSTPCLRS